MTALTLLIGNKNYSSWSMRAWLAMQQVGVPYDETLIPLYEPTSRAEILRHSPSGRVPCLIHGDLTVWDSLAICEYLAEAFPRAHLWPSDLEARAVARSVSSEMHSGFRELRQNMPMNIRRRFPGRGLTGAVQEEIERIFALWNDCRRDYGSDGPFLFGSKPTIADWMYAPVITRLETYEVKLPDGARAYADAVLAHPFVARWIRDAQDEPWIISKWE